MKKHDNDILKSFSGSENLTRQELKRASGINDDTVFSSCLKELIYFEYIKKDSNNMYSRTSKEYNAIDRSKEKKFINYKYEFNKVFAGSYLKNSLGHEVINFIKSDDGTRYIYVNPWGNVSKDSLNETKYVFHIIESSYRKPQKVYELVAISEVDSIKSKEIRDYPVFMGYGYNEIFDNLTKAKYGVSFVCSNFYIPNECKIFIEIDAKVAEFSPEENDVYIKVCSNPQHSISFATDGKKIVTDTPSINDFDVLDTLLESNKIKIDNDSNIHLNECDDELSYAMISGRASLEVSMSNLIAYFLRRDQRLCREFISKCLLVPIDDDEEFEICREENDIDILIKSNKNVIVIENKIDSDINGKKEKVNGGKVSQLSKYYEYVKNTYKRQCIHCFVLVSDSSGFSKTNIKEFLHGDKYDLFTYNKIFSIVKDWQYSPNGLKANEKQKFLFSEFIENIKYLTLSKAEQAKNVAYMRLKQTLDFLESRSKSK